VGGCAPFGAQEDFVEQVKQHSSGLDPVIQYTKPVAGNMDCRIKSGNDRSGLFQLQGAKP
jgi:hypothetical protein